MTMKWLDEMPGIEHSEGVGVHNWKAVAEALKLRPGVWALVAEQVPRSNATAIRRGERVAFRPPEDWLVVTRNRNGHRSALYMAFVGAPGARIKAMREK